MGTILIALSSIFIMSGFAYFFLRAFPETDFTKKYSKKAQKYFLLFEVFFGIIMGVLFLFLNYIALFVLQDREGIVGLSFLYTVAILFIICEIREKIKNKHISPKEQQELDLNQ